ncbi:MAG: DNA-binding response regulator [Pseudonocardia sp.]
MSTAPDIDGSGGVRAVHADEPLSILVVDAHQLFAMTLEIALVREGYRVHRCATARSHEVLGQAAVLPPGLALVDVDREPGRGADPGADLDAGRGDVVETIRGLVVDGWTVVVVTGEPDDPGAAAAALAGAGALVAKSASFDTLLDLVRTVAAGRQPMLPLERRRWLAEQRRVVEASTRHGERLARLTLREREVLDELAAGYRPAAIARRADVAVTTVRSQIRSILGKLEVCSQLEAVALLHGAAERTARRA